MHIVALLPGLGSPTGAYSRDHRLEALTEVELQLVGPAEMAGPEKQCRLKVMILVLSSVSARP